MNLKELDSYFRTFLAIDDLAGTDFSLNGVQVENTADITCIAFAVDATLLIAVANYPMFDALVSATAANLSTYTSVSSAAT